MSAVVFDTSAVIALLRSEPGAAVVAARVGQAAMSAVNLQELVKALILRGLALPVIEEVVQELRLDLYSHDREAAFAAAQITEATRQHGSGLGDRSCMALAIKLGVPVLTTDRAWAKLKIPGLVVELVR
ncbi:MULTISPECIES: PIN domain-containing protein [Methylorubrum]|uniref:PIN domain-containing protein n=1 Tax=Methylorubrum TaxID=2282523 RepID=UPI00209E7A0C|nr:MULTISPECIES: type II toxin-antitoxin system VapC family toxin [Methylorubrum]MCJ2032131.1 type II toxin-antitoxin system VapC family toxin [Methylobacterium sp. J-043]MCP1551586.1 PIN domain nuclease of toxin-antitoxin system [Methylorubrum zatmanii]MDF9861078.1 ribonuclease VapC [Methylorubrum pseudosasae]MDH6640090.1 ribonuclease VapC [Methylobacterium sp. SuP10 SLI 274]MCP1556523.1 PIN domain nuclease of toxin-antitoxin system [Methylorubrum extorquens]